MGFSLLLAIPFNCDPTHTKPKIGFVFAAKTGITFSVCCHTRQGPNIGIKRAPIAPCTPPEPGRLRNYWYGNAAMWPASAGCDAHSLRLYHSLSYGIMYSSVLTRLLKFDGEPPGRWHHKFAILRTQKRHQEFVYISGT